MTNRNCCWHDHGDRLRSGTEFCCYCGTERSKTSTSPVQVKGHGPHLVEGKTVRNGDELCPKRGAETAGQGRSPNDLITGLLALNDHDLGAVIARVRAERCLHCGGPSRCHCQNDE